MCPTTPLSRCGIEIDLVEATGEVAELNPRHKAFPWDTLMLNTFYLYQLHTTTTCPPSATSATSPCATSGRLCQRSVVQGEWNQRWVSQYLDYPLRFHIAVVYISQYQVRRSSTMVQQSARAECCGGGWFRDLHGLAALKPLLYGIFLVYLFRSLWVQWACFGTSCFNGFMSLQGMPALVLLVVAS